MIGGSDTSTNRRHMAVTCVVLVLAHLVLAPHVQVFGAVPGFLLVLTACLACLGGARTGTLAGFVLGLLFDLTGAGPVGLSALLCAVAGYALGNARPGMLAEGWRTPLALFAACALAYNVLYLVFLLVFGTSLDGGWALVGRVVAGTAVDVVVGFVALFVLNRVLGSRRLTSDGIRLG
ncbi:MAG: rod shape-determining protein MreD [Coriobacteriia bacterium]|nr:rod shape-determining protein MreD [Coriobacteriia bacterium]MBS5477815.1 rod shape-determining protein MreD [Coriobacteriia bacterium]